MGIGRALRDSVVTKVAAVVEGDREYEVLVYSRRSEPRILWWISRAHFQCFLTLAI